MLPIAIQFAVIATTLIAGVFLSFSDFIMRSLTAAQPAAGVEAMQEINRKVYRSVFLTLFFAMTVGSVLLVGVGAVIGGSGGPWLIAGGAVYLTGVFAVTVFGNVPMNKQLDALPLSNAETLKYWRHYAIRWTRWNHVRTISSALSAIMFLIAIQHL